MQEPGVDRYASTKTRRRAYISTITNYMSLVGKYLDEACVELNKYNKDNLF